jgi:hypothetical protein
MVQLRSSADSGPAFEPWRMQGREQLLGILRRKLLYVVQQTIWDYAIVRQAGIRSSTLLRILVLGDESSG